MPLVNLLKPRGRKAKLLAELDRILIRKHLGYLNRNDESGATGVALASALVALNRYVNDGQIAKAVNRLW